VTGPLVTRRGALVGGGASAMGAAAAVLATRADAAPSDDRAALMFLLATERLQAAFYVRATEAGELKGDLARFAATAAEHEAQHVALLERALGTGEPVAPRLGRGVDAIVRDPRRFAVAAAALEDLAVAAANGQAANLTGDSLARIASIVSVDARHATWIRELGGLAPQSPTIDGPVSADRVLAALRREGLLA
jgi:hypothetical protein